jgi:hypothetical protein
LANDDKEQVREVKRLDVLPDGSRELEGINASTGIHKFFEKNFSVENFSTVFSFMEHYLDYDKSKPSGQWYCKTLYAIVCTRAFYHIKFLDEPVGDKILNSRKPWC